MKIVINRCFGGYGLSPKALMELIPTGSPAVQTGPEGDWKSSRTRAIPFEQGYYLDRSMTVLYKDGATYWCNDEVRDCPHLVAVVERLGDAANDPHAELHVVEIPDGVEWEIDNYDGRESIHEKHRSWC